MILNDRQTKNFWSKVIVIQPGCWFWTGAKNNKGYGHFRIGEARVLVHRLSYELINCVSILPKFQVNHVCFTPACVNPQHLELVTHRENNSYLKKKNNCSSQYTGVHLTKKKTWRAQIKINKKTTYLGEFTSEYEAHIAYQTALIKLGE